MRLVLVSFAPVSLDIVVEWLAVSASGFAEQQPIGNSCRPERIVEQ